MSLDMSGFIDSTFESVPAVRTGRTGGGYTEGIWVAGTPTESPHTINLQRPSDKERQVLIDGGERLVDARKIYVNDGIDYSISEADTWVFTGVDGVFKTVSLDNRPWRNYCRAIVSRIDE